MKARIGKLTDWIAEVIGAVYEFVHLDRWRLRDEAKPGRRNFPPPR